MLTTRTLGTQGLTVSALGLGCMGMSQSYGTPAGALSFSLSACVSVSGSGTSSSGWPGRAAWTACFRLSTTPPIRPRLRPAQRAASAVRELAARKGVPPGQIALAWLLHKGPDIVPIPGTKRRRYLEENVGAAAVSLSAEEMADLDAALPPEKVAGPCYGEKQMAQVDI